MGAPAEEFFSEISQEPVAAASLGQVRAVGSPQCRTVDCFGHGCCVDSPHWSNCSTAIGYLFQPSVARGRGHHCAKACGWSRGARLRSEITLVVSACRPCHGHAVLRFTLRVSRARGLPCSVSLYASAVPQVYKAKLRGTGDVVAVKVQRPGVLRQILLDVFILRLIAGIIRVRPLPASSSWPWVFPYGVKPHRAPPKRTSPLCPLVSSLRAVSVLRLLHLLCHQW